MARFEKGKQPRAGRPKGSINRSTRDAREAIVRLLEANAGNLDRWLTLVADGDGADLKPDPARALEIVVRLCEFHIPKLARAEVEHTGGIRVVALDAADLALL